MAEDRGLVSIVMPCCGQLEHTRLSLPRVLKHSRAPFELLFLDAGSLDGTREYLEGVATAAPLRVEVLRGSDDTSFTELVEEAVAKARGTFVAWVNNDVLVPEQWLQQLTALASANEKIGVVGPLSNLAGEKQRAANVSYRLRRAKGPAGVAEGPLDTQEVDRFAREVREANKGQWGVVERLGGFCWLAKRALSGAIEFVIEKGEEERLASGRFSIRSRQVGTHLAVCRDLFVHHF